ncbi:hypothetical protein Ddye_001184 [Dipteronia dyeriana]|uniref:Uncharacterized protein n=1 Tax=Dipteronia dyeriana TaxID=168575 RepID=A0AAD9XNF1_9ROSI|nr:hypothetical protein Ddye_001184 [Dipteronia dyeriana]
MSVASCFFSLGLAIRVNFGSSSSTMTREKTSSTDEWREEDQVRRRRERIPVRLASGERKIRFDIDDDEGYNDGDVDDKGDG